MAAEIIAMLKEAFAIVGHPDLRRDFAARDLWGVVGGIAPDRPRSASSPPAPISAAARPG